MTTHPTPSAQTESAGSASRQHDKKTLNTKMKKIVIIYYYYCKSAQISFSFLSYLLFYSQTSLNTNINQ